MFVFLNVYGGIKTFMYFCEKRWLFIHKYIKILYYYIYILYYYIYI